ncbi:ADP-ribosylation factor Arf1 [Pelomyxa schiedti]|nr:ADP-ribosylation factor Arf1 [Pelomyxa schiedti]
MDLTSEVFVLRAVFLWLGKKDLVQASRVCAKWHETAKTMVGLYYEAVIPGLFRPSQLWLTSLSALVRSASSAPSGSVPLPMRDRLFWYRKTTPPVTAEQRRGHVCCCCADTKSYTKEYFRVQHASKSTLKRMEDKQNPGFISKLIASVKRKPFSAKVLMLGLDNAGKTFALYLLQTHEYVTTIPTMSYNVETIPWKHLGYECSLELVDIRGGDKTIPTWQQYFPCDALFFFVDSQDVDRILEAKAALHLIVGLHNNYSKYPLIPVVIFAAKQDLPDCLSPQEIAVVMDVHSLKCSAWRVQGYSVGDMLVEISQGVDWVVRQFIAHSLDPHWGSSNINQGRTTFPLPLS